MSHKNRYEGAISSINHAIKELKDARNALQEGDIEDAETEIGEALRYIGKALIRIHHDDD